MEAALAKTGARRTEETIVLTITSLSMWGRVVQSSDPSLYAFVDGLSVPDRRARAPAYNVAPSRLLYVIRENQET